MKTINLKSKYYLIFLIIFSLSVIIWLLSSNGAPLRFTTAPLKISRWHILAALIGLGISLITTVNRSTRPFSIIPLFFSIYPLSYMLMAVIDNHILGTNYTAIQHKFLEDILFFILEIGCFFPLLFLLKDRLPFPSLQKKKEKKVPGSRWPLHKKIGFVLFLSYMTVVLFLSFFYPLVTLKIPLSHFTRLLVYQIPFALFLGIKEEFEFRWILMRGIQQITHSRVVAVLLQAIPWALYHSFFGEGTGVGLLGFSLTFTGALWFSYLVYEFKSLTPAILAHIAVELLGFYLMYHPFLE